MASTIMAAGNPSRGNPVGQVSQKLQFSKQPVYQPLQWPFRLRRADDL